jgi:hypothetical protein
MAIFLVYGKKKMNEISYKSALSDVVNKDLQKYEKHEY